MAEQNRREANIDSPEAESQEAGRVLENSVQRIREQTRSEAPETTAWMDNGKRAMGTVLDKGGSVLLEGGKGIVGVLLYIAWESLKEIKEDFKERIVNPLLKKVGAKPLKIKKIEDKDAK